MTDFAFPLPSQYRDRKYVSQHFGENPQYYKRWGAGHAGTDIAVPTGTPVYAARTGQVVACRADINNPAKYLGLYVIVQSADNRFQDLCAHLSEVSVHNGAQVTQGDRIGLSGATGNVTGPHLHFGERPIPKQDNGYRGFVNVEGLLFGEAPMGTPDNAGNVDSAIGPIAAATSPKRLSLPVHVQGAAISAPAWILIAYLVLQVMIQSGVNPGFPVADLRKLEGVVEAAASLEGVDLPAVNIPAGTAQPTFTPSPTHVACRMLPALDRFNIHTAPDGPLSGYGTTTGVVYCVTEVLEVAGKRWLTLERPEGLDIGYVRAHADNGVASFAVPLDEGPNSEGQ